MYKEASKLKLRFETGRGVLTTEQLWDLPKTVLATVVRNLKKKLNKDSDNELAFLDDTAVQVDKEMQLRFDIAKDIYITRKAEEDALKVAAENKAYNQKILTLISEKKDEELKGKSVEELTKLLKD